MADYKEIKGEYIKRFTSDPVSGQVAGGSWASGGTMNTARYDGGAAGTQTANLTFGGYTSGLVANNESYNGTSWTEVADLPTATYAMTGSGTSTAAFATSGQTPGAPATNATLEFDGSSWTSGGAVNQSGKFRGAFGASQTAATIAGGFNSTNLTATENYDGTSWATNPNGLPTATNDISNSGLGTQAAGFIVGGANPNATNATVEYAGADVAQIKTVTTS